MILSTPPRDFWRKHWILNHFRDHLHGVARKSLRLELMWLSAWLKISMTEIDQMSLVQIWIKIIILTDLYFWLWVELMMLKVLGVYSISEKSKFWLQRNYRFFFMFVFSTTLLCIYVFGFCWVYIRRIMQGEQTSIWKAMIKTPASIVLIVYTFISMWFVGGLTAFHLYLISTNQVWYPSSSYNNPIVWNSMHLP